jgi:hypothetical protein
MIRVKAMIGVCAICALAISSVVVQSAAGASTTGFTCKEKKEPGGAGFSGPHCASAEAVGTGAKFEHVAIAEKLITEGHVTGGVAKLKSVQSGVTLELQAIKSEATATGMNNKSGSEHFIEGTGVTTYSGVTVTSPAGKGCSVKGGAVVTNKLFGTSKGLAMEGILTPASGETFAEFTIEGCSIAALNHIYTVKGSVRCGNDGATITCTHASTTEQGTLTLSGQKAGVEVSTTVTAANGTALSATT